jgi:hypothetical protein
MGLSEQWVASKAPADAFAEAISDASVELRGTHNGWTWARGWTEGDVEDLTAGVARRTHAAAAGGWVADSDCAYLVFAEDDGRISAQVAVNETMPFGEEIEGMADLRNDLSARQASFDSLAEWARRHASPIDSAQLAKEMPGLPESSIPTDVGFFGNDDCWMSGEGEPLWIFAEDGVRLIYHRLGIDSLDEAAFGG